MKQKASEHFFPSTTHPEEFSKTARSAAEEFVRYCREHHLPPTYELFSKWIAGPPGTAKGGRQ